MRNLGISVMGRIALKFPSSRSDNSLAVELFMAAFALHIWP